MYDIKALYEAGSVDEAIRLLKEHPEAHVLAGGSDVLIKLREGKLAGESFVSIYALDEMRGVKEEEDGTIRIGSLTSFSHVIASDLVQKHFPSLANAVSTVGGPQIRNIGTIGGNTCNGVTSADSASTLLTYDAEVELTGSEGKRLLPLIDFYIKPGVVDLKPGELQTAILIRKASYEGYKGHYIKYAMRNAMDIATLGCAVNVKLSADKKVIEDCRIAYGVAGPVPMRAEKAEAFARGKTLTADLIDEIAAAALEDVNPRTSWRASKEFRLHLIETMTKRGLTECIKASEGVYA